MKKLMSSVPRRVLSGTTMVFGLSLGFNTSRYVSFSEEDAEASFKHKPSVGESQDKGLEETIKRELMLVFAQLDKDHDGHLTAEEVKVSLDENEHFRSILTDANIPQCIAHTLLDKNGDGVVTLEEMLQLSKDIAGSREEQYDEAPPLRRLQMWLRNVTGNRELLIDRPHIRNLIGGIGIIAVWSGLWNMWDELFVIKALPAGRLRFFLENGGRIALGLGMIYFPDASFSINDITDSEEDDQQARMMTAHLERLLNLEVDSMKTMKTLKEMQEKTNSSSDAIDVVAALNRIEKGIKDHNERLARLETTITTIAKGRGE